MTFFITRARAWYNRFERPISSASLIGGFIFDAFALKRVDLFWENFWVVVHLVVVALCIILINLKKPQAGEEKNLSRTHFWLINILQFSFGGLLSTFLVFYFRSATLAVTWPFLLFLALAFIANDRLKKHYARLTFQISFFFLSLLSFTIFIVPVLFHRIGTDVFLVSGLTSLAALWLFLVCLGFFAREKFRQSRKLLFVSVSGIFLAVNVLYFLNLIPPIPLSLKDGGVYHSISRDGSGNYVVQSEDTGWLGFLTLHQTFHATQNDSAYAYSAIFSPTSFATDIVHEWQKYDEVAGAWVTSSRVDFPVTGGREQGYRAYSIKNNLTPGKWRVNVETSKGQIIGRLRFNVVATNEEPALKTEVKN